MFYRLISSSWRQFRLCWFPRYCICRDTDNIGQFDCHRHYPMGFRYDGLLNSSTLWFHNTRKKYRFQNTTYLWSLLAFPYRWINEYGSFQRWPRIMKLNYVNRKGKSINCEQIVIPPVYFHILSYALVFLQIICNLLERLTIALCSGGEENCPNWIRSPSLYRLSYSRAGALSSGQKRLSAFFRLLG